MKKIALTGNIAAGKSQAEKIIKDFGFKVLDADNICHNAILYNKKIISEIKITFKNYDIFDVNGFPDRNKLGKTVFADEILKQKLENILHPFVKKSIDEFFQQNNNKKLLFVSVPLLFEAGMENMFDKIILVTADEKIRLERLMKRNNYDKTYALKRINAQIKQELKIQKADFILENNSNLENLKIQTEKILNELLNFSD